MKLGSYNGKFVGLIHKLSNNQSRVQFVELRVTNTSTTDKWDFVGQPFVVDSVEVQPLEFPPMPVGLVKRELTMEDMRRLDAARGLNLAAKNGRDMRGLRPALLVYNLAVKQKKLAGSAIEPVAA